MREREESGIYWGLGLSIKWLKMSIIKLRKHREKYKFSVFNECQNDWHCVGGEVKASFGHVKSARPSRHPRSGVVYLNRH